MKIFRPLKTNQLNQGFGENFFTIYKEMGMLGHNGEDWSCWKGEPIYHSADWSGFAKTEVDQRGGIGVDIISEFPIENTHYKLRYWHLLAHGVYDGQIIKPGDLIGWGDSTGWSTGNHLHWALKPCYKDGKPLYSDNGFRGAINLRPYFENIFILDYLHIRQQLSLLQQLVKLYSLLIQKLKGR